MTNLNEKEMELLKAVIAYCLEDLHNEINGKYRDGMYYEIVDDDLEDYEAMLRLMDEFECNGDVLNYLEDSNYLPMGIFKIYIRNQVLDEIVEQVAEDNDLEEYAENVIKFLKSPQVDYTKEKK